MYNKMNNGEEVAADHLLTTRNPNSYWAQKAPALKTLVGMALGKDLSIATLFNGF